MRSNYRVVGDFIKQSRLKNEDGRIDRLLGVNLDKKFMPSVANLNGVDLTKYKVIKKGQFGCKLMSVGRDKKVPLSRLTSFEEAIISSAYFVFEVKDENKLNPEYLMMWFSRSESDRFQWFQSGGDIRGRITWEEFCSLPIKVPSIEKQREIVKEYNTIVNRIKLNEQLKQKLEETAQALYKNWFVDFEFPNENGKPYKSSGGEMVYNEELDQEIPEGWCVKSFTEVVELKGGGTPRTTEPNYWDGEIPFFTPKDVDVSYYSLITEKYITHSGLESCSSKLYPKNTVFVTARGTVGAISLAGEPMAMNQSCYAILGDERIGAYYIHQLTIETIKFLKKEAVGAVFKALVTKDFEGKKVINPPIDLSKMYDSKIAPLYNFLCNASKQIIALKRLSDLVLQNISKVESPKTEQVL